MVSFADVCRNCGKNVTVTISHTLVDHQLHWHSAYACPYCGIEIEEDDFGTLSPTMREKIIAIEGKWALSINDLGANPAETLQILRHALNLALAEVAEYKQSISGIVASGTRLEMELVCNVLNAKGIDASAQIVDE